MALRSMLLVRRVVLASLFIAGLLAGDAQAAAGGRLPMPISAPNSTIPSGTAAAKAAAPPAKTGGVTLWAIASKDIMAELGTKLATKVKDLLGGKQVDRACGQVVASAVKTVADDYDVTVNSLKKEIGRLQMCRTQLDSVTKELIQCKAQSAELNKCNIKLAAAQKSAKAAAERLATCESDYSDLEETVQELADELESCTAGNDDNGTDDDTTDDNTDDVGTGDDTTDDNTDDNNTSDDGSTPSD